MNSFIKRFKLSHKSLALAVVLLAFELVFVGGLAYLLQAEAPVLQAVSSKRMWIALSAGGVCNILLVFALSEAFRRGITRRIEILVDNTRRLGAKQSLNEQLQGDDEIAQLDQTFHHMAQVLKEADEKEKEADHKEKEADQEEQEAQRLKHEVIAVVTHDLRSPLNAILAFFELLDVGMYGEFPIKGQEALKKSRISVKHMISLIGDLLDIETIRSGNMQLDLEQVAVATLLDQTARSALDWASINSVSIVVEPCDLTVKTDRHRILQVLVNLVNNAIKCSPRLGKVHLGATSVNEGVEFYVQDEGKAIPETELDEVFERFQPAETSDATEQDDSGLVMAICKAIVELHGGRIGVTSKEGHGSRFFFVIP